jgi:hypothetical protein
MPLAGALGVDLQMDLKARLVALLFKIASNQIK